MATLDLYRCIIIVFIGIVANHNDLFWSHDMFDELLYMCLSSPVTYTVYK